MKSSLLKLELLRSWGRGTYRVGVSSRPHHARVSIPCVQLRLVLSQHASTHLQNMNGTSDSTAVCALESERSYIDEINSRHRFQRGIQPGKSCSRQRGGGGGGGYRAPDDLRDLLHDLGRVLKKSDLRDASHDAAEAGEVLEREHGADQAVVALQPGRPISVASQMVAAPEHSHAQCGDVLLSMTNQCRQAAQAFTTIISSDMYSGQASQQHSRVYEINYSGTRVQHWEGGEGGGEAGVEYAERTGDKLSTDCRVEYAERTRGIQRRGGRQRLSDPNHTLVFWMCISSWSIQRVEATD